MTNRCEDRLTARHYSDPAERIAYRKGYADGYANRQRNDKHELPNAYGAGYWDGQGDNKDSRRKFK